MWKLEVPYSPRRDATRAPLCRGNCRKQEHLLHRSLFRVLCGVRVKSLHPVRQPSVAPATPCSCWKERDGVSRHRALAPPSLRGAVCCLGFPSGKRVIWKCSHRAPECLRLSCKITGKPEMSPYSCIPLTCIVLGARGPQPARRTGAPRDLLVEECLWALSTLGGPVSGG